jgi:hypothetical protein
VVRVWIDDIPADPEALRAWLAAATTARWTEAGLASPRDME